MSPDQTIGRYRRWYARLLRLYPRPFQQRFAEPMAQTFTDLMRERRDGRGLHAVAVAGFADTSGHILRENVRHLMQTMNYLRWVVVTAVVLAVPALLMALRIGVPDPGSGNGGLDWGPMDFLVAGVLVLGAGLLFEYASSRGRSVLQRAAVAVAVLAGLGLVWGNLAVGFMEVENGNLLYVLVLFVALLGAAVARFEPREASVAMFATAATHAVVALIGLVAGLGPTLLADAFWVAGWIASGLLFRQAALSTDGTAPRGSAAG